GEAVLIQRLEQLCLQNGFTTAQFMQLDSLLGRPINEYLEQYFHDLETLQIFYDYLKVLDLPISI
ncbi:hypothetical protein EZS27_038756, partial [termite gut metagenome]